MDTDELDDDVDWGLLSRQFPRVAEAQEASCPHEVDALALASYVYPTNVLRRDYQYNIVARALYHNTLVALPTGLGKTFIASTVMLNYMRWFPALKIVFMAPTRPLVAQQIRACCGGAGIDPKQSAVLLDKTRRNRAAVWASARVFFTTPQVVENDLAAGLLDPKQLLLLVVDEAHRARGNYAYTGVARRVHGSNRACRVLALTATPAADVEGVQEVVDNLHISRVEVRTERSIDISRYLKRKTVVRFHVEVAPDVQRAVDLLGDAAAPVLKVANDRKVYEVTVPARINAFTALDAQQRLVRDPLVPEGLKWANYFVLQLLVVVGQGMRRLNVYGVRSFYSYFREKHAEYVRKAKKLKNALAHAFYTHPSIAELLRLCESLTADPAYLGHGKLDIVIAETSRFLATSANPDSRVIVFTEFRELALDIVRVLEEQHSDIRPHIFIGQAREKEKSADLPKKNPKTSSEKAQASGMNQKLQKEIISKFKQGTYNVLVATSIGEEGLDIGEVDLIVCYDSTSSPIKNIQRMGRTGRNRDGKVVLLFSSNEESKFDKAMAGYEYIQQHIMSGNVLQLHEQERIIPPKFTPVPIEQYIELPKENAAISAEDDDDEVLRMAAKYMTNKAAAPKSRLKAKTPKKPQKQFFIPENVNTGFQLAGDVLKNGALGDNESAGEAVTNHTFETDEAPNLSVLETPSRPTDLLDSFLSSDEEPQPKRHRAGLAQPEIMNFVSGRSLGVRKRPMRNGDQSLPPSQPPTPKAPSSVSQAVTTETKEEAPITLKLEPQDGPRDFSPDVTTPQSIEQCKLEPEENDVIKDSEDELDAEDEILAFLRLTNKKLPPVASVDRDSSLVQENSPASDIRIDPEPNWQEIETGKEFTSEFEPAADGPGDSLWFSADGLLTEEGEKELYLNYFHAADRSDFAGFGTTFTLPPGQFMTSTKTRQLLQFRDLARVMIDNDAALLILGYEAVEHRSPEGLEGFVEL